MSATQSRRGLIWAIAGAIVLLIATGALIIAGVTNRPDAAPTTGLEPTDTTTESTPASGSVVDAGVRQHGWLPEPVTTNRDTYIRAALAAASTFDASKATRDEFLAHLKTWFTADTRWSTDADQQAALDRYLLDLSQSVVLPEEQWAQMRSDQSTVTAKVTGPIKHLPVPNDPGGMSIGTADVTMTYSNGDASNDEHVRVSVQVLCGPTSVPAPNSPQQAGDCKVVRFFDSAVEG